MATTKLWHIQGRLKDLVDYVENPDKTVKPGLQDFFNVFSYAQNPSKTADGQFVTAINCQKDIALYACQRAGIETVPAFAVPTSREEAAIALVDSNLHREHILPSEKAFAYKLKMDALRHQGTSRQPGEKLSVAQISEAGTDSERQIHRYIRLTELTPELLTLVDDGRISLTPAVEISYLSQDEQYALLEAIQSEDRTPSLSQAQQLRKLSQSGELDADRTLQIMCQPKANQMEKISLDYGELRRFFPRRYTPREIQAAILKLVEADYKRRQRAMER